MASSVTTLTALIAALVFIVDSSTFDNYYDTLIRKYSKGSYLLRSEFAALATDVTAKRLPATFSSNCDHVNGIKCDTNNTAKCFGYDDIFEKYSNDERMDNVSLGKAVPALLFFSQHDGCAENTENVRRHQKPSSAQAWGYGIGFVTFIVLISNIGAFLGPCMKSQLFKRILMFCVALAVGTLGATGLLVLIPESLRLTGADSPVPDYNWKLVTVLGGIYFVYICERMLKLILKRKKINLKEEDVQFSVDEKNEMNEMNEKIANHGHSHFNPKDIDKENGGVATVAWILLLGDAIHNFVDGLSIGAAFTENVLTGISVSLAVVCEELPHELGDIAILLHSGLSIKRALFLNFLAAITCYIGLIIGILVGENTDANTWIFAFAGGLFVYLALVDMIPEMNEQAATSTKNKTETALQIFLYQNSGLLLGFLIIILISVYGKYIEV